jgi:hypothetical protein
MDARNQTTQAGFGLVTTRVTPPRGLFRLTAYATGKQILILGPGSAGKTRFCEYLRLGALGPGAKREITYHITKSPTFVIKIGKEPGLVLKVRQAVDTPGQVGPVQHANLVGRRRPHAVVVVLDCSKAPSTTLRWLRLFCNRLDTVLRRGSQTKKRLNEIVVLLNKRDKITHIEWDSLAQEVKGVLRSHLSVVMGADRLASIPILECICVQTPQGTILIDEVIHHLAARLTR